MNTPPPTPTPYVVTLRRAHLLPSLLVRRLREEPLFVLQNFELFLVNVVVLRSLPLPKLLLSAKQNVFTIVSCSYAAAPGPEKELQWVSRDE